ncbi:PDR/VanB family oxidoreductase [Stutzerimonas tarimensis]|uniref:PDR/VanB family oxidoreductase n=1 Tax=Stutzerimonas tarimensis TaxID=1507735 RepID=A0ABV7T911_9GAMM
MLQVRIARKAQEALDIVTLELAPVEGEHLPAFSAGSHIDVEIRPGLVRQYSLCNDPTEKHRYLIGVLRDPGSRGGSVAVHDELQEGQVIHISPPRNHFALTQAPHSLLLAGGIGVTPILCMAERLAQIGSDFEMHYCSRSPERMAFRQRIAQSGYAGHVHEHFDDGDPAQKLDLPTVLDAQPAGTHLYVCGPAGFIDFVSATAEQKGWGKERIHFEYFAAKAVDTSDDGSFEVQVASTGKVYTIGRDDSIVSVLAEDGVEITTSCEQGICGACITRVLQGQPDHRDQVLTDQERNEENWFTPCCSRSLTPKLVLDI